MSVGERRGEKGGILAKTLAPPPVIRPPAIRQPVIRKLRTAELARPSREAMAALPRHPLVVVLDDIRSAHNVGSILRTADAVRAEAVVCCGVTPPGDHRAVAKTALGAEATVPWRHEPSVASALRQLRDEGYRAVALEQAEPAVAIADLGNADFPLALVLGNEVTGVSEAALAECDAALTLPQWGAKHSLNVSVAFGVAAYGLLERLGVKGWAPG